MSYYFEIWLRGHAKDTLREISEDKSRHPHITLIRPFQIKTNEESIKNDVSNFCKNYSPLPFTLEGKGNFDEDFYHVPVTNADELLNFRNGLEKILESNIIFNEQKPEEEVHLHSTVNIKEDIPYYEKTDQYMLRLTGIENKRIWFSYDLVTGEILNREESKKGKSGQSKWYNTVHQFTEKTGLLPTRNGYQKIK